MKIRRWWRGGWNGWIGKLGDRQTTGCALETREETRYLLYRYLYIYVCVLVFFDPNKSLIIYARIKAIIRFLLRRYWRIFEIGG